MSDEIKNEKENEEITTQELNEENAEESVAIEEKVENEIPQTKEIEEEINQDENKEDIEEIKEEVKVKKEKKFKLKYLIILLAIILAIVVLFVLGIIIFANKNNKVGNSIGNIRAYGYTASQGNYIYYIAPEVGGDGISIYKSKKDGSDVKTLLSKNWSMYSLNVRGDYIYFIAIIDPEKTLSEEDPVDNKIYRMKLDGTDLQIINDNNFHNESGEIFVIKNKVYYIGEDLNIYSMDLNGENKNVINDDQTGFIGINEKYIIFNKIESNNEELDKIVTYYMNLDGTNKKAITGERLYSINIMGDNLYYVDANKDIYKVNLKTGENILIAETEAYNLNASKNALYFMNFTDETGASIGIYKINLDGSEEKLIIKLNYYSKFINVIGNKITFADSTENEAYMQLLDVNTLESTNLYTLKYNDALIESSKEVTSDTTASDTTN